jgi:hypothetical protein
MMDTDRDANPIEFSPCRRCARNAEDSGKGRWDQVHVQICQNNDNRGSLLTFGSEWLQKFSMPEFFLFTYREYSRPMIQDRGEDE